MALMDPYTGPWTTAEAAHLSRRTTFGADPATLANMVSAGMSATVDAIVDYLPVDQPLEDKIAALVAPDPDPTNLGARVENFRIKEPWEQRDLEGWWIYRMVNSSQPFQQQFTLFLHDHFVSEWGKVGSNVSTSINDGNDGHPLPGITQSCTSGTVAPDAYGQRKTIVRLMQDQQKIFREQGHLSFRDTLIAITRDVAMLIYLDNRLNIKGKAQENYAREVMELFTMGVGNYTENDVREVAKCFTGETVRTACSQNWPYDYFYDATKHDTTTKTVFTVSIPNTGAGETVQVLDLILNRVSNSGITPNHQLYPATALYMAWKFITWFVNHDTPIGHDSVRDLAIYFASTVGGYKFNVRETLRKLLKSQYFYDMANRNVMYKHPADYMVTGLRALGLAESSYTGTGYDRLRKMGMQLFAPPTVDGWQHGKSWINSGSLIARFNYADRLSATTSILSNDAIEALITNGHVTGYADNVGIRTYFTTRLLQDYVLTAEEIAVFDQMFATIKGASTESQAVYRRKVRSALHLTMTMPRYQTK